MNILRPLAALALALPAALLGCGRSSSTSDAPAIAASSDPAGRDLVEGAVVAAQESSGGYRLYKIVHVDDYPEPIGYEYHMIAYNPKAGSVQEAAKMWREGAVKIALDHIEVRQIHFQPRDHRVIAVEKVTEAEAEPYRRATAVTPTPANVASARGQ